MPASGVQRSHSPIRKRVSGNSPPRKGNRRAVPLAVCWLLVAGGGSISCVVARTLPGSLSGVEVSHTRLAVESSDPPAAGSRAGSIPRLFETADRCIACHNNLVTSQGLDVSIGADWRGSMMANSARDPYWQAAVRREILDHPSAQAAIEDECSKCHMPMARYQAHAEGGTGSVFENLPISAAATETGRMAADGVSCTVCHQILPDRLGSRESFVGQFVIDETLLPGRRPVFGPFDVDPGRTTIMRSSARFVPTRSTHVQRSELCATCHTLITHSLNPAGEVIGEMPEQVPYLEWQHSSYRDSRSCQDCHMPVVEEEMPITGVWGQPRAGFSRHSFRGGNFFMIRMLNRYRDELGVEALPQELELAARRTIEHLETASARLTLERVERARERLEFTLRVENLAGHKLPTAYPSRRVWIQVTVVDAQGRAVFESGAPRPDGSIAGNDNDSDASRFEPHYEFIDSPERVQIYEAVMVDPADRVTTGLLTAVRFIKDNRLLPAGFDKTRAAGEIAVRGAAADDADFESGGDRLRYRIPVDPGSGPFQVRARLWYQPIGYRWARNLAGLQTAETDRFAGYYRSLSESSAVILAEAGSVVP